MALATRFETTWSIRDASRWPVALAPLSKDDRRALRPIGQEPVDDLANEDDQIARLAMGWRRPEVMRLTSSKSAISFSAGGSAGRGPPPAA
jgi:hypothetical protein